MILTKERFWSSSRLKSLRGILFILLLVAGFSSIAITLAGDPQPADTATPPAGYVEIVIGRFFHHYFVKSWAGHSIISIGVAMLVICAIVLAISRAIKRQDALERDF